MEQKLYNFVFKIIKIEEDGMSGVNISQHTIDLQFMRDIIPPPKRSWKQMIIIQVNQKAEESTEGPQLEDLVVPRYL